MFKGIKPPGQPRSLRSIVESENDSKNLLAPAPPEPQPVYKDGATDLKFAARSESAASKRPFK